MVLENAVSPFSSWIGPAFLQWLLVIAGLAVGGLIFGFLVAVLRNGPLRATAMTWQAIRGAVVDLFLISPRRVWALACLAVKESIRRRVLVGFLVFVLILLFASWFLDPNSVEPARLYMSFVLTASSYLVLLLVLFLSVFSLPADIRSRTLHTVMTKPVRHSEVVLGRMLGFILIGTGLLGIMGFMSYFFVVRGLAHTHAMTAANLKPVRQIRVGPGEKQPLEGYTDTAHGHRHKVHIKSDGSGQIDIERRHWHGLEVEGSGDQAVYHVGPEEGSLVARVPVYGKLAFRDREGIDAKEGISVGYEWAYRSYIQGGSPAAAIWTFTGLRPEDNPDGLHVEMNIEVFRTHKGDMQKGVLGSIAVRNPDNGLMVETEIFESKEFSTKQVTIPVKLERKLVSGVQILQRKSQGADGNIVLSPAVGDPKLAQLKETDDIDLYKDLVTPDGRLEIWLRCVEPGQYFGAAQADLYLRAADALFTVNFAKGYLGIWLQMVLVIGFGVMFSTFLSGPVAMMATIGALIGGLFNPFMAKLATGKALGGGPLESMIRLVQQQNMMSDLTPTLGTEVAQSLDVVSAYGLKVLSSILPSFSDFSYANFVADGFNIDANTMLVRSVEALAFFVPVFIAGYFFMKMREVAR